VKIPRLRPGSAPQVFSPLICVIAQFASHLIQKAGFTRKTARTGAVTLIQRFGSALNLNLHFHMLFLDGVYVVGANGEVEWFRWVRVPTTAELTELTHTIAERVGRFLQSPSPADILLARGLGFRPASRRRRNYGRLTT
jgi:hypothetical protein